MVSYNLKRKLETALFVPSDRGLGNVQKWQASWPWRGWNSARRIS